MRQTVQYLPYLLACAILLIGVIGWLVRAHSVYACIGNVSEGTKSAQEHITAMPLYDAYGKPISRREEKSAGRLSKVRRWLVSATPQWLRGWKLLLEIAAVLGFVIAFYTLRPVLSVTSLTGTGIDGIYGVKVTISDSAPIQGVSVQCVTNKVIFEDKFTAAFERFVSVTEYSVGDVKTGESFTVNCYFAWSFWDRNDAGVLILGYPTPRRPNLGIPFRYVNGSPVPLGCCPTPVTFEFADTVSYIKHKITAVDASFIISYKWRFSLFRQERIIHMIESPGPEEGIRWRVAPASEPTIADGSLDGWKMTARSNSADFSLTMKRAN